MNTSPFDALDPARKKLAYERAAQVVRDVKAVVPEELRKLQEEISRRTKWDMLRKSVPPIFSPFFSPARYKGAHGGRGSAKSQTFGRMVLHRCKARRGTRVVCVREVQKSLEQSVKRLLEDLIEEFGLGAEFKVLNTHIETPGDGIIIFNGMQNHTAESIKSLEGYDIAWVEEAQSLSARSLMLLRPTLRKADSEIWMTWNPRRKTDPVDEFFRGPVPPPNSIVIEATYRDNPFLPQVLKDELEWDRRRDIEKYNHVWLGQYERYSEARVFRNWKVEEFETPSGFDPQGNDLTPDFLFGGDWGFAIDPTVGVRGWIDNIARRLYIDHEVYKVGCEIDHTPALFDQLGCTQRHLHGVEGKCDGMARSWPMVTDSARPETISYMQRHGYPNVLPAKKGAGSIEEGVQFLKNYDIIVHPRCRHVEDELTSYRYKTHPLTEEIIPVLEDKKNHTIDAIRYMVEPVRVPQLEEWVTW